MADQLPELDFDSLMALMRRVFFFNDSDTNIRLVVQLINDEEETVFEEPFLLQAQERGQLPIFEDGALRIYFVDNNVQTGNDSQGVEFVLPDASKDTFIHISPERVLELYATDRTDDEEDESDEEEPEES